MTCLITGAKRILTGLGCTLAFCGCTAMAAQPELDLSNLPLHKLVMADLESAARYAETNGYPARAAVYRAIAKQVEACEAAIAAALPAKPPEGSTIGAITAFEIGAEAVGRGVPAAVKINCSAIVLP